MNKIIVTVLCTITLNFLHAMEPTKEEKKGEQPTKVATCKGCYPPGFAPCCFGSLGPKKDQTKAPNMPPSVAPAPVQPKEQKSVPQSISTLLHAADLKQLLPAEDLQKQQKQISANSLIAAQGKKKEENNKNS